MSGSRARRLLAVMFTDVVGYTALMQRYPIPQNGAPYGWRACSKVMPRTRNESSSSRTGSRSFASGWGIEGSNPLASRLRGRRGDRRFHPVRPDGAKGTCHLW